jgi:putative nucleotidyltransferase with HDIG domain
LSTKPIAIEAELVNSKQIHQEANTIVANTLRNFSLGKPVALETLRPIVSKITASILRNPDALISLLRIKQADTYTFQHSVAVGTLLISFCHALNMDKDTLAELGLGGLLHDIGKMLTPKHILNKPGVLNKREFEIIKQHVIISGELLENLHGVSESAFKIIIEHHERYDGSGYPLGLKANEISRFGQVASIVDVYDALTSNRIYHLGCEPTEALKMLLEWSGQHFDPLLVQQFIRTLGIYPVGSLVMLESGLLGVVVEQNS